jgi:hypothetical protein
VQPPAAVAAQVSIGAPGNNLINLITSFGSPNPPAYATPTYGQTFQTPDAINTVLNNFTFYLTSASDLYFRAYVYAWDQANQVIVGPALFASAILEAPTDFNCARCVSPVFVNTGNLSLTAGTEYVAMFNASGTSGSGYSSAADDWTNSYAGGYFLFSNNGNDFSRLFSTPWDPVPSYDLEFNANFSRSVVSTPEPSTLMLIVSGLVPIAGAARRRRRA